jgi:hypothetical protein
MLTRTCDTDYVRICRCAAQLGATIQATYLARVCQHVTFLFLVHCDHWPCRPKSAIYFPVTRNCAQLFKVHPGDRQEITRLPVRLALFKQRTGGLVVVR